MLRFRDDFRRCSATAAQGLTEYLLIAVMAGVLALGGLVVFNEGLLVAFQPVKQYLASVASVLPQGVNGQLKTFQQQQLLLAQQAHSNGASDSANGVLSADTLYKTKLLMSQLSPTQLPEVTGGNSDIAKLSYSASQLIAMADQLERMGKSSPSLNVSELVMRARILAISQLMKVGLDKVKAETTRPTDYYNRKGWVTVAVPPELKQAKKLADLLRNQYGKAHTNIEGYSDARKEDYAHPVMEIFTGTTMTQLRSTSSKTNQVDPSQLLVDKYKKAYDPINQIIQTQSINTQQSNAVKSSSQIILTQAATTADGTITATQSDRINQCGNADCSQQAAINTPAPTSPTATTSQPKKKWFFGLF